MADNISLKIKNFRAIAEANIDLNGITVITGENGSGKSTISKLTYHLLKTVIDFDTKVYEQVSIDLNKYYDALDIITKELSEFIDNETSIKIRNSIRRLENQAFPYYKMLFEFDNTIKYTFDLYIKVLEDYDTISDKNQIKLFRLKNILSNYFKTEKIEKNDDLIKLLNKIKADIEKIIVKAQELKNTRPLDVLFESLEDIFFDEAISKNIDLSEFGVPIIDREDKKLAQIHSFKKVAYIDTPMIIGNDLVHENRHWSDINYLLSSNKRIKSNKKLDFIFSNEVIKGDVEYRGNDSLEEFFIYKREDGKEFNLIDCATGLKSFGALQILFKNGFFDNNSLLILDEPEAHLHPQWVVEYARLIVLLNKHLGAKFLIASHHPDMISAIKYISQKEGISKNLKYYLAKKKSKSFEYKYKNLGLNIEPIFSSFNIALERMDTYGNAE